MMASMAVGGVMGQNIAGTMNHIMSGMNQSQASPPPVPAAAYHVAVNGQDAGTFEMSALKQMAQAGQFMPNSLVWKAGMSAWAKAGEVEELKPIFSDVPPAIPTK